MKREVPRRIPGILPFVWHGDDVRVVEVRPLVIAPLLPTVRRLGSDRGRRSATPYDVVIELLGPKQGRKGLAHHVSSVGGEIRGNHRCVELIRLTNSVREYLIELVHLYG